MARGVEGRKTETSEEMNADDIDSSFLRIYGSDENDAMNGGNGADSLYGNNG